MAKPKIAIIGAGRVGSTLGRLLHAAGYPIGAIVARHRNHAERARRFIGAGHAANGLSPSVLDAQVLLLATPDAAIGAVARQLAQLGRRNLRGKIVLHTSGALASDLLKPLARQGARVSSMHPLQTFARPQASAARLRNVPFTIEGDPVASRQAARLTRALGGQPIYIFGRHKALYHAAAALACGHLLALVDRCSKIFIRVGMPPSRARRAVTRLVRDTLENFERLGGGSAWTGPLERRDLATLRLHARALGAERGLREAYRTLGELALRLYRPRDRGLARGFRKLFG